MLAITRSGKLFRVVKIRCRLRITTVKIFFRIFWFGLQGWKILIKSVLLYPLRDKRGETFDLAQTNSACEFIVKKADNLPRPFGLVEERRHFCGERLKIMEQSF